MLSELLAFYVDSLNKQGTPNVNTAWDAVLAGQINKKTQQALKLVDTELCKIELPLESGELLVKADQVRTQVLDLLFTLHPLCRSSKECEMLKTKHRLMQNHFD